MNTTPYGSWKSPITSDLIVAGTIGLEQVSLDGETVYWIETRPSEQGRAVVMRANFEGKPFEMTSAPYNARSSVHEYGGGALLAADGVLYFTHFGDQRLYRLEGGLAPEPLTPLHSDGQWRYADADYDKGNDRLICVREEHRDKSGEVINTLVCLPAAGDGVSPGRVLAEGNDFYASPAISPDGKSLAWITWNHPNMPWDGTELWLAEFDGDGGLQNARTIAGGLNESIYQPEWSPDGGLYYVSDRTGWWSIYRYVDGGEPDPVLPSQEGREFGRPQWVFNSATYGFLSAERIACCWVEHGVWRLGWIDLKQKRLHELKTPYTEIRDLRVDARNEVVYVIAGSPTLPLTLLRMDFGQSSLWNEAEHRVHVLRRTSELAIDEGFFSAAQEVEFPTGGERTAYGFFYKPKNKDFQAPQGEKPPLIVYTHGGPTGMSPATLNLSIQYWTSRGIAVLDVNYGGSTGYGRAYRERLNGKWGIVDVDDCTNGALYLARQGLVDENRLAIRGGSAGGYTTLAALTFRGVFKAGASYYGVSDIEALASDTHKFESRYLDNLIGPYPASKEIYQARSPIRFTDHLSCPVIFFQGLDDKIVPPNQAEMMVEALRKKKMPVAYITYEGEGHGFRKGENIKRSLDSELYFYSRVFGFTPADPIDPPQIENFPGG